MELLGSNRSTIAKHCQKMDHLSKLPPKETKYRGLIQGRQQLKIKEYVIWNPEATLNDILIGCDLKVSKTTLRRYLHRFGLTLTDDIRQHLMNTFKDRLQKCLKAKGDLIKF